jgi:general nucleoside transport system ATP-binding protein
MTVAENVALGSAGPLIRSAAEHRVAEIGVRTGLALDARARAGELSVGAQQRLEIVKALARNARALILDEPTAVLAPNEIEELLRWIRGFADAGNAVVLITHKLREALAIADDVTVLRRGRVALRASATTVTLDILSDALLGGEPTTPKSPSAAVIGDEVATAESISVVDARGTETIRDASFVVRSGEIVGIAGVEGAGQRDLLRVLSGRLSIASGVLRLPVSVGFVPEDRQHDALVLDFTIAENLALRGSGARRGRINPANERAFARAAIAEYDIRGANDSTPVRALSGGNQQKVVLARELADAPRLIVVENPTRGLDIRATSAVHDRLRIAATAGAGVVVYSSDLDEVLALATRVLVVYAGTVRETLHDREAVGRAMLGVA